MSHILKEQNRKVNRVPVGRLEIKEGLCAYFFRVKKTFGFVDKKNTYIFAPVIAKVAQLVEHNLAKVRVAGSSPVFRSR